MCSPVLPLSVILLPPQVCLDVSWQSFLIPVLFSRAVIGNAALLQADCLLAVLVQLLPKMNNSTVPSFPSPYPTQLSSEFLSILPDLGW